MSLNADFTIYPDLSFRKLVYYGVQDNLVSSTGLIM